MTLAFSFYNSVKKTLPGSFQKVEAAKKPKLMAQLWGDTCKQQIVIHIVVWPHVISVIGEGL